MSTQKTVAMVTYTRDLAPYESDKQEEDLCPHHSQDLTTPQQEALAEEDSEANLEAPDASQLQCPHKLDRFHGHCHTQQLKEGQDQCRVADLSRHLFLLIHLHHQFGDLGKYFHRDGCLGDL